MFIACWLGEAYIAVVKIRGNRLVAVENKLMRRRKRALSRAAAMASANRLGEEAAGESGGNKMAAFPISLLVLRNWGFHEQR